MHKRCFLHKALVRFVVSNSKENRTLLNVPFILTTRVLIQNQHGQMVPDATWHDRVRILYRSLIDYMLNQNLIHPSVQLPDDISSVVLRTNDLTEVGLEFWKSGAVDRWLGSFDRSPNKSVTNYTQLERSFARIRAR